MNNPNEQSVGLLPTKNGNVRALSVATGSADSPIVVRQDGSGYRVTIHADRPALPKIGEQVGGFIRVEWKMDPSLSDYLYTLYEEFLPVPNTDGQTTAAKNLNQSS